MTLDQIWRYPVKSMAGERLPAASLTTLGLDGDRIVQVVGPDGRVLTSRSKPRLLGHRASLGAGGEARVDGIPWNSPETGLAVSEAAGPGARLVKTEVGACFDVLPLLVITDGVLQAFGRDLRRLRPNLVIGGAEGLVERSWEGRQLRVGGTLIGLQDLRERCIMTTFDPDTGAQDVEVLRDIRRRFGGTLGLNAWVVREGRIAEGDPVELIAPTSGS